MHEISPSTRVRYERTFPLLGSEGSTRRGEPRGSSPTRAPHKPEKSKLRIRIDSDRGQVDLEISFPQLLWTQWNNHGFDKLVIINFYPSLYRVCLAFYCLKPVASGDKNYISTGRG